MSSLLKEAIVDAKALKEAALKNAEASIIEKYSIEVKETLDRLLEQDDLDLELGGLAGAEADVAEDPLGGGTPLGGETDELGMEGEPPEEVVSDEDVPLAAADGLPDEDAVEEGEPIEFDLNLNALSEAIKTLEGTLDENQEFEFSDDDLYELLNEGDCPSDDDEPLEEAAPGVGDDPSSFAGEEAEEEGDGAGASAAAQAVAADQGEETLEDDKPVNMEEAFDTDSLIDAIVERLTVDMGADLTGWAGRSSQDMRWAIEKEMAHRRSTDVEDEMKTLKKAYEELVFENKQLSEQTNQYKQVTNELKESLQDVNLSNARLLYTNRVLRNTSLNERQKERIVEAISSAGSVTEARTIFDTLQSTAQSAPKRAPKSLSEAITRRSSVIRASRTEKPSSDPFQDRMMKLAGIK
tara:strand:- start:3984 stop:5213 length:1230 start_codon:yes stop_codon:yes gene_type:complete